MSAAHGGSTPTLAEGRLPFDRFARLALILACLTLVIGGAGFTVAVQWLNVYLKKKPVPMRQHFDNISLKLGPWEAIAEAPKLSKEMVEELGTDKYLDRQYAINGEPRQGALNLHLAYYTGMIDAVPHVPDRCLVGAGLNITVPPHNVPLPLARDGWRVDGEVLSRATGQPYQYVTYVDSITRRVQTVRMPQGEFRLRTVEFSDKKDPGRRIFGGYFFIANGRVTPTPEGVKKLAFIKSEEYAYYCKVQLTMSGSNRQFGEEEFVRAAADFVGALLPELMRCLPDWSEIEAQVAAAPEP